MKMRDVKTTDLGSRPSSSEVSVRSPARLRIARVMLQRVGRDRT